MRYFTVKLLAFHTHPEIKQVIMWSTRRESLKPITVTVYATSMQTIEKHPQHTHNLVRSSVLV